MWISKRCAECRTRLDNVTTGKCPYCERAFDPEDATTYYSYKMRWYDMIDFHIIVMETFILVFTFFLPAIVAVALLVLVVQGPILTRYGDLKKQQVTRKEQRMHLIANECIVIFFVIAFAAVQYALQTYVNAPTSTP